MKNKAVGGRLKVVRRWPFKPSALVSINLSILIIMSCSLLAGQSNQEQESQEPGRAGKASSPPVSSLLKKNQLPQLNPDLAVARRDLFRPSSLNAAQDRAAIEGGEMAGEEIMDERPEFQISDNELLAGQQNTSLLESLNFIYSGLIFSGQKALALILIDGQALALTEGEEIIPGLKLVKITPGEILIKDSQGNSRKIKVKENTDD
ncbi:MAG TPA: hypothetical protein DCW97_05575 [Acidobacteria bacterium]|nr:hypothetical protein [Acidobacteriota bacterium]